MGHHQQDYEYLFNYTQTLVGQLKLTPETDSARAPDIRESGDDKNPRLSGIEFSESYHLVKEHFRGLPAATAHRVLGRICMSAHGLHGERWIEGGPERIVHHVIRSPGDIDYLDIWKTGRELMLDLATTTILAMRGEVEAAALKKRFVGIDFGESSVRRYERAWDNPNTWMPAYDKCKFLADLGLAVEGELPAFAELPEHFSGADLQSIIDTLAIEL